MRYTFVNKYSLYCFYEHLHKIKILYTSIEWRTFAKYEKKP